MPSKSLCTWFSAETIQHHLLGCHIPQVLNVSIKNSITIPYPTQLQIPLINNTLRAYNIVEKTFFYYNRPKVFRAERRQACHITI